MKGKGLGIGDLLKRRRDGSAENGQTSSDLCIRKSWGLWTGDGAGGEAGAADAAWALQLVAKASTFGVSPGINGPSMTDQPEDRTREQRIAFLLEHLRALNEALAVAKAVKAREMDPAELSAAVARCDEIEAGERLKS